MRSCVIPGLMLLVAGCGPSAHERTLSVLNIAADDWDGDPDFAVAGQDAWGNSLHSAIEKTTLNHVLEIRSAGPDGLLKNNDDLVVVRRERHGESTITKEVAKATGAVMKSAASGAVKGIKEGIGFGGNEEPQAD
jgi:hypothetical protein